jgi:hypothetical protein
MEKPYQGRATGGAAAGAGKHARGGRFAHPNQFPEKRPSYANADMLILIDIRFLKISKIAIAGSTGFKVEHL